MDGRYISKRTIVSCIDMCTKSQSQIIYQTFFMKYLSAIRKSSCIPSKMCGLLTSPAYYFVTFSARRYQYQKPKERRRNIMATLSRHSQHMTEGYINRWWWTDMFGNRTRSENTVCETRNPTTIPTESHRWQIICIVRRLNASKCLLIRRRTDTSRYFLMTAWHKEIGALIPCFTMTK